MEDARFFGDVRKIRPAAPPSSAARDTLYTCTRVSHTHPYPPCDSTSHKNPTVLSDERNLPRAGHSKDRRLSIPSSSLRDLLHNTILYDETVFDNAFITRISTETRGVDLERGPPPTHRSLWDEIRDFYLPQGPRRLQTLSENRFNPTACRRCERIRRNDSLNTHKRREFHFIAIFSYADERRSFNQ